MAKMWPRELPLEIRRNELREAECRVYAKLREVLDDGFHVYYSRPWLGLRPDGSEVDGEADFVVAHAGAGLLTIEVKGGGVSYDPSLDNWISRDRYGLKHKIKNPVGQARSAKHEILSRLKQSAKWRPRRIVARHGVILPDSSSPGRDLGIDMPLSVFCFLDAFEHDLSNWIRSRLTTFGDCTSEGELGSDGLVALEDLLAHPFQMRMPLSHITAGDDKELHILSTQQFQILTALTAVKRAAVAGGAGTGKTVLAVEKAVRCSESGTRTLLTCYNSPLALELARKLSGRPNLEVLSFHSLCLQIARAAGATVPEQSDKRAFFDDVLPELLMQGAETDGCLKYGAIIVDEGQDFLAHWWPALEAMLDADGNGSFYVFYDDNQRVYQKGRSIPGDLQLVPVRLTLNLRNTRYIHEAASIHYAGTAIEANGPYGMPVEWRKCEISDLKVQLGKVISRLIGSEGIAPHDVAVLFANEEELTSIAENGRVANHSFSRCDAPIRGQIGVDTVRRFKGLESLVVVVVATRSLARDRELRYIALSRPRTHLVVLGAAAEIEALQNGQDGR